MKWYWHSTTAQVSGTRKCITASQFYHFTLFRGSVFSELRVWLSGYKRPHSHTAVRVCVLDSLPLFTKWLKNSKRTSWPWLMVSVISAMVTGPCFGVIRVGVCGRGVLFTSLWLGSKERDGKGLHSQFSPSRSCPQQPKFLSLDPTSSEFHFLPKENSRVVPWPYLQHTGRGQLFEIQTATPWEKTKWQKMLHGIQESNCFLNTLCWCHLTERISIGGPLNNFASVLRLNSPVALGIWG